MCRTLLVVVVVVASSGCTAFCDTYCDGTELHSCIVLHGSETMSSVTDCPDSGHPYCVEFETKSGDSSATCVLDDKQYAGCQVAVSEYGPAGTGTICEDAERIGCIAGFIDERETCASAEHCAPGVGRCLVRPGVRPECAGRPDDNIYYGNDASYCEGTTRIICLSEMYAIDELSCGGQLCYASSKVARCAASLAPDPACTAGLAAFHDGLPYEVCADNAIVKCLDRVRIGEQPCEMCAADCAPP